MARNKSLKHDKTPKQKTYRASLGQPLSGKNQNFYRFGVITSHSIFYHEVMIESRVVGRLRFNHDFRSEERFSRNAETDLVCRLLLEKKKESSVVDIDHYCSACPPGSPAARTRAIRPVA